MTLPDAGASPFFTEDHRACDAAWAAVEEAAQSGDAARVRTEWSRFAAMMDRHLRMEEEVLFPAFEEATGMKGHGPTEMMRFEHRSMRALLRDMAGRLERGDVDGMLDQGDTLLMVVQQHNAKEEGMLYPMADRVLGASWTALAAALRAHMEAAP